MISISKITDSATRAIARLASQFKNSTNLIGLITAISDECQTAEDALWDLFLAQRDVDVATGATLDNLGSLVGAPVRGPRDDETYRNRILGQIVINRSSGESGSIYEIAKRLVSAWNVSGQPRIAETGPGCYTVRCDPPTLLQNDTEQARELAQVLVGASSAGVRAIVFSRSDTVGAPGFFRFAGGTGPSRGFGQGAFIGAYDR